MDTNSDKSSPPSKAERDYALLLSRKARKKIPDFQAEEELSLVPYLDVMMNLVIFMLVTIASFMPLGILSIFPPSVAKGGEGAGAEPEMILTVGISETGFWFGGTGGVLPQISKKANGEYDYEALGQKAREIKSQFPKERTVVIVADEHIRYEVLVKTMDALRGTEKDVLFDDVKLSASAS